MFTNLVLSPVLLGQRLRIEEAIVSYLDYDRAGKDRTELAEKMIRAQLSLAKGGYSTGGRPPYGFRRSLVKDDGTRIRELSDGERVGIRGHHVLWLPGPEDELLVIRRVLSLLKTMPASRVARMLTDEGVPAPDAGRTRTDNGVEHITSGVWHATTISNIARNPLLVAIVTYGRRSMGDQRRLTANGPRVLTEEDFRPDGKVKVIRNKAEEITQTSARFDPLVNPLEHEQLIQLLDRRGGTHRGKPRSRDPNKNPLGARIFDVTCGWPMYRVPRDDSFTYTCGAYMQSRQCDHNRVDGPTATRFVMTCLRQKLAAPHLRVRLQKRPKELAVQEQVTSVESDVIQVKRTELAKVRLT